MSSLLTQLMKSKSKLMWWLVDEHSQMSKVTMITSDSYGCEDIVMIIKCQWFLHDQNKMKLMYVLLFNKFCFLNDYCKVSLYFDGHVW